MRNLMCVLAMIVFIFASHGCSGGNPDPVTLPPQDGENGEPTERGTFSHFLFGKVKLVYDPGAGEIKLVSMHTSNSHYDLTDPESEPLCNDCITVGQLWHDEVARSIGVAISLKNPGEFTFYDVRGMVRGGPGLRLIDNDGFTGLFSPEAGKFNPYHLFCLEKADADFTPGCETTRVYSFTYEDISDLEMNLVVEGSYPGHSEEPVIVRILEIDDANLFLSEGFCRIRLQVVDRQGNLKGLIAGSPYNLWDGPKSLERLGDDIYEVTFRNENYLKPGTYSIIFTAWSVDPNPIAISQIAFVEVHFYGDDYLLADSPWPKINHDSKNTGRSEYMGPQTSKLKWKFKTKDRVISSAAIANDGTIYVGSQDRRLYAINPDGTIKWEYRTEGLIGSSPTIRADGVIYIGSADNHLYAINPDGEMVWRYETGDWILSSPAIATDGSVIFGSVDHYIYSLKPGGTLKWKYETGNPVLSSAAFGDDGTIYIGSEDYHLYALNYDGTLQWKFKTGGKSVDSAPSIGGDGTIYVGSNDNCLYAINPDGSLKWKYNTGGSVSSSPGIGFDGTIYIGSWNSHFYAFNPAGELLWDYAADAWIGSSPAIGADGTIYAGSDDHYLYALTSSGSLKWKFEAERQIDCVASIGEDGTLYAGSWDGYLYAFGD